MWCGERRARSAVEDFNRDLLGWITDDGGSAKKKTCHETGDGYDDELLTTTGRGRHWPALVCGANRNLGQDIRSSRMASRLEPCSKTVSGRFGRHIDPIY